MSRRSGRCHRELATVLRWELRVCGLALQTLEESATKKKKPSITHLIVFVERRRRIFFLSARGMLKMCAIFRVMLMANNGAKQSLLLPFFFPLPRNKSRRTYCMSALYLRTCVHAAASRARRRGCRLSGGVSACSVTTTPGVRLITEGSKGHELHSGGGSLRGPLRSDSSSNLKGHI